MDEIAIIILVLLGLATVLLILPIVALVKAGGARRTAEALAADVRALRAEVATLRQQPHSSDTTANMAKVSSAATAPPLAPVPEAPRAPEPPSPAPVPEPPPAETGIVPVPPLPPPLPPVFASAPVEMPPTAPAPQVTAAPPSPAAAPEPAFNWEQFIGVKLFAWIAGLGLLFTAVYFLRYSIAHGWIPPAVRAALGFLLGGGLLVGGLVSIRRQFVATGQSLTGTGIVMLYAVTVACRRYYEFDFFQGPAAAALLILITVAAFTLAVRLNAQVVALLGMLGGFLTPIMLSTGVDNPPGLFGFIALLDLGILAVALHRRWNYLAVLAAFGTAILQIGWAEKFFELAKLPTAVVVLAAFGVLFAAAVYLARRLDRASDWIAGAALVPPGVAFGFSLYFCDLPAVAARAGWILGNILVADLALLAVCALYRPFAKLALYAGLAAFGAAAVWIGVAVDAALLPWALAFVVVAAALHSGYPFLQERLEPGVDARRWSALFPPLALALLLIPFAVMEEVGWLLWPVVLLVNLLALGAAAVTRTLAALAASLLLTLLVLGVSIAQLPAGYAGGSRELLLVAAAALFFCGGALWLLRRFGGSLADGAPDWSAYLPDATAALPFVLVLMLVLKLQPVDASAILGVCLLLVALLHGIAIVARRGAPVLAAFVGTLLVEYTLWHQLRFTDERSTALVGFVVFGLGFLAAPFAFRRRLIGIQPPWAVAALALPLHFNLIHRALMAVYPHELPGLLAVVCALPPLAGLVALLRTIPESEPYRLNRLAWFGAATLFFLTLVFPLQFSRQWITLGWALEGAALLWLFHRIPHPGLRLTGVALLAAVFARLILNPAVLHYAERSATPVFNWILGTYGVAAVCCFVGMRLLATPRDRVLGLNAPALLATLGTILAFALVNFEIADFFTPENSWVRLEFSGNFARDMSYTIAWALFALLMIVVGISRRVRAARYAAIALLGVTVLKLFLHDTASLETIWRIAAFAVVSIVALAASFLFQRFLRNNSSDTP